MAKQHSATPAVPDARPETSAWAGRTLEDRLRTDTTRLDADTIRRWVAGGLDALSAYRAEIDALNVYPVPDGDTGSNLLQTWQAGAAALDAVEAEGGEVGQAGLSAVVLAVARGAFNGAHGNSGSILCAWLAAFAGALANADGGRGVGAAGLSAALRAGAEGARTAVARPVEGTMLTVADTAAASAGARDLRTDLPTVASDAAAGAAAAVAGSTSQLAALEQAGVVDAGGRGLCVLIEALVAAITREQRVHLPAPGGAAGATRALVGAREAGSGAYAYEVQYLLAADARRLPALRTGLGALGDSLVVVGTDDLWHVHVHVNDVGAAVEVGIASGRPHRITVTRFADELEAGTGATIASPRPAGRAVLALVTGDGLDALFADEHAEVLRYPDHGAPSLAEMAAALARCPADVVVLTNDELVIPVAQQAVAAVRAADPRRSLAVVPTRSPVQGLAALAVADAGRPFGDDVIAMAKAAGATRVGAVIVATDEALTSVGHARPGDVLGLLEGDVVLLGQTPGEIAEALVDRMLDGGGELLTLVTGSAAAPHLAADLLAHVAHSHELVEVTAFDGGQGGALLLVGVE